MIFLLKIFILKTKFFIQIIYKNFIKLIIIIFLCIYLLKFYIYFPIKILHLKIENNFFHKIIESQFFEKWNNEKNNLNGRKNAKEINIEYIIENGDTLTDILTQYGIRINDINLVIRCYPVLNDLKIGQSIFCTINKNGKLKCLIWNISKQETRIYTRISNSFKENILDMHKKWNKIVLTGKLVRNFISSARSAGLINIDIKEIIRILQWKLDFRKLHKGDQFSVLLIRKSKKELNKNNQCSYLLGIHFKTNGKDYYAFRAKNGKFYGKNADLLSGEFIRFPIKTKFRISSSFNTKRIHPIVHQIIPHRGVDFAVPSGTPVLSVGDGKVIAIKNSKIAGNYITIQHNLKYITRYMHLKKSLVRIGQNVKLGEYIAISGNTGRSTGPHLHFETWINHKAVNPLTVILPKRREVLTGNDREKYLSNIRCIINKLQFN